MIPDAQIIQHVISNQETNFDSWAQKLQTLEETNRVIVEKLESRIFQSDQELLELSSERCQLSQALTSTKTKLDELSQNFATLQNENAMLTEKNLMAQDDLKEKDLSLKKLEADKASVLEDLLVLKSKKEKSSTETERLRLEVDNLLAEARRGQEEIDTLTSSYDYISDQLKDMESTSTGKDSRIEEFKGLYEKYYQEKCDAIDELQKSYSTNRNKKGSIEKINSDKCDSLQ